MARSRAQVRLSGYYDGHGWRRLLRAFEDVDRRQMLIRRRRKERKKHLT
jgi:hypothetical protein